MNILEQVYNEIVNSNMGVPYESGGLLGGNNGVISRYCIDAGIVHGQTCYYPNVKYLNGVLSDWMSEGVSFYGFFSYAYFRKKGTFTRR